MTFNRKNVEIVDATETTLTVDVVCTSREPFEAIMVTGARYVIEEIGLDGNGSTLLKVLSIGLFTRTDYHGEKRDSNVTSLYNDGVCLAGQELVTQMVQDGLEHFKQHLTEFFETEDYILS